MCYPPVVYGFEDKNQDCNWGRDERHYDEETRRCDSDLTVLLENSLIRSDERLDDSGDRYGGRSITMLECSARCETKYSLIAKIHGRSQQTPRTKRLTAME